MSTKPVSFSIMVFVLLRLSKVTFDGLPETPLWNDMLSLVATSAFLRPFLLDLQSSGVNLLALISSVGLVSFFGIFLAVYLLFEVPLSLAAVQMARWFVLTLVPIAIACHLAHHTSFFALAGQLLIPLASDPTGRGWDLFGTAHIHIDVGVISARLVWYTAFITIVLGHIITVNLAHAQVRRMFEHNRSVLTSQIPMLVLLAGYTKSSLWILAQPVVKTQALG